MSSSSDPQHNIKKAGNEQGSSKDHKVKFARRTSSGRYVTVSNEDVDLDTDQGKCQMASCKRKVMTDDRGNELQPCSDCRYVYSWNILFIMFNDASWFRKTTKPVDPETITEPYFSGHISGSLLELSWNQRILPLNIWPFFSIILFN